LTYLKLEVFLTLVKIFNEAKSLYMITNSDFNFQKNEAVTLELPFSEHIEELRQRLFPVSYTHLTLPTSDLV